MCTCSIFVCRHKNNDMSTLLGHAHTYIPTDRQTDRQTHRHTYINQYKHIVIPIHGCICVTYPPFGGGVGGVFLLEVQYSILKSLISTCVLSYVGSREDWLLDRICESKKDCWDSIRRTSYPYQ